MKRVSDRATAVGREIRNLRQLKGLRQEELASLLGHSASYLSKVETGYVSVPPGFVTRVMDALQLTMDERVAFQFRLAPPVRPLAADPFLLGDALQTAFSLIFAAFGPRIRRQLTVDPLQKAAMATVVTGFLDEWYQSHSYTRPAPLILDSGTGVAYLAHAIMNQSPPFRWRCYTGNLLAALYLAQTQHVNIIGGGLDRDFGATLSDFTVSSLPSLLTRLEEEGETASEPEPIGVLAVLAFDPWKGPYARARDPHRDPQDSIVSGKTVTDMDAAISDSNHMRWKAEMLAGIRNLVVLVNPDKFARAEALEWRGIAAPVVTATDRTKLLWPDRLKDAAKRTHIVTALPERAEARALVVRAVDDILAQGFVMTDKLFGSGANLGSGSLFLTVLDPHRQCPLARDEIGAV